jgi:antimicrobial peptide system SdpA family protein
MSTTDLRPASRPARENAAAGPRHPDPDPPDPMLVRRVRTATAAVVALLIAAMAIVSLPSRVHLPRTWSDSFISVQSLVPQGWAFFTRNPREASTIPYVHDGTGWVSANRGPNTQPRYLMGANRESRLTEFDVSLLLEQSTTPLTWTPCAAPDIASCAASAAAAGTVSVLVQGYQLRLCGEVLLIREEPIPLAYAGLGYRPPKEAIRLDVTCQELA